MKRFILFCCLLGSFLQVNALTTIEGVFREKDSTKTTIFLKEMTIAGLRREPVSITETITGQSTFRLSLDLKRAAFFQLYIVRGTGNEKFSFSIPLYVLPDGKIQLSIISNGPRRLRCDAQSGLDINNLAIITQQERYNKLMLDKWEHPPTDQASAMAYLQQFDQIADSISQFPGLDPLVHKFIRFWSVDAYSSSLFQFYPSKQNFPDSFFSLPPAKIKYSKDPFMTIFPGNVQNIVNQLNVATGLHPFSGRKTLEQIDKQIHLLKKQIKSVQITDPVIELLLNAYISRYKVGDSFNSDRITFNKLTSTLVDKAKRRMLMSTFNNLEYTIKGAGLPPVSFQDATGSKSSLEQFKGKYLLLDIWASWCVPCCKMMPVFQQLEREYEGKPITFVGLSVDGDSSKWVTRMSELNMHGYQLWDNSGTFMKYLNINAIPHYLLYSPDGKLLNYNMGSPESPEFKRILDQAIQ
ncbi:TlpA family protein disulfide reductase [Chitinophaga silvatica]|nr:TlpA disulfide reductase family protein [Chitinophaga silvatica]